MKKQKALNYASDSTDALLDSLLARAKKGDEAAFGQLYEFYFDKIYTFIYYRVNHKEIAEDLAEDVFVRAWSKIRQLKADSFGGWLYSIARNRIIDHYRQRKETADLTEIEHLIESSINIADETNLALDQKLFLDLVKQLTPEQQIIIKLKFIEDLENSEISELISKSEGSIRVTQHRAIQKLQQLLEDHIKTINGKHSND